MGGDNGTACRGYRRLSAARAQLGAVARPGMDGFSRGPERLRLLCSGRGAPGVSGADRVGAVCAGEGAVFWRAKAQRRVANAPRHVYTFKCVISYTPGGEAVATNLAIDDKLINEARRIGGHATKKEAVTVALQEYVGRRKQQGILKLFGTIDFDKSYNVRRSRNLDRIGTDQ